MKNLFLTFVCLLFLTSCVSEEEQRAFKEIGDYYGTNVTYTKSFSNSINHRNVKALNLILKGGSYVNKVPLKKLAPYAATLLNIHMKNKDIEKYTHIGVKIYKNEQDSVPAYEDLYRLPIIYDITKQSAFFQKASRTLQDKTAKELYELLPANLQTDTQKAKFVATINKMKKERGGIKEVKLVGVGKKIAHNTKAEYYSYEAEVLWGNTMVTQFSVSTSANTNILGVLYLNLK